MKTDHQVLAQRLRDAYRGRPVAPLRDGLEPSDGDGAYEVQAINTEYWRMQGRRITGRKVGLTAKVVQTQLGVNQPDFGVLFADMKIPDGGELLASTVIQPRAEAEIALVMAQDINQPNVTHEALADMVAHVLPAIEIVDSRISDWKITFADTVADNGSSAFYVLGDHPLPLKGLDLWTCGMALEVNEEVRSLGAGVACLGHPLNAATWLAQTLAARGQGLRAGDVILTGALGPMTPIVPGDKVRATIGGLGSCSFSYREDRV